jgi:hypothetical protein
MDNTTARPCAPRARCKCFRTCPICARIRQAKIADAAERLAAISASNTWTTIMPNDRGQAALLACRAAFLRAENAPGALWTVELSPTTGALHCNVLHPTSSSRAMRAARIWQAPIDRPIRDLAAYISKREQMPDPAIFDGRLYGTTGPLWQYLAGTDAPPTVAAAKTQYDIDPDPLRTRTDVERRVFAAGAPMTRDDYREIAARRLPDLLRAVPLTRPATASQQAEPVAADPRPKFKYIARNSRRMRWLQGTLRPWEKTYRPK